MNYPQTEDVLREHYFNLINLGPTRMMIGEHEATLCSRARDEYDMVPHVVFVREDGWMLAAPAELEAAAYKVWKDSWLGFCYKGDTCFYPIQMYMGDAETNES